MSPLPRVRRMRWWAALARVVSRSIRARRAVGNRARNTSSTCWVPRPKGCKVGLEQAKQTGGAGWGKKEEGHFSGRTRRGEVGEKQQVADGGNAPPQPHRKQAA